MAKMGRTAVSNNASAMKGIAALRANAKAAETPAMSKPKKKGIARRVPRSKRKAPPNFAAKGMTD